MILRNDIFSNNDIALFAFTNLTPDIYIYIYLHIYIYVYVYIYMYNVYIISIDMQFSMLIWDENPHFSSRIMGQVANRPAEVGCGLCGSGVLVSDVSPKT